MNAENVTKWFEDKGDVTLSINYALTEDSTVFDVGGYEGNWASKIVEKYNPNVHIFEPVEKFYNTCRERFKDNPKVHVYNYGLADCDASVRITLSGDSSGMYTKGENTETVALKDIVKVMGGTVDLISINIEGGEYVLLQHMLDSGIVRQFRSIQVQFHENYHDCEALRDGIRKRLKDTHVEAYCYPFVWESWSLVQA